MAEAEPTLWELMRLLQSIDKRLDGFVTQQVFRAEQEANRRAQESIAKDLSDWKAESRGEHARLDGRMNTVEKDLEGQIKAEREAREQIERSSRESRSRTWLSIALAAAGAVVSISIAIFNNVTGG